MTPLRRIILPVFFAVVATAQGQGNREDGTKKDSFVGDARDPVTLRAVSGDAKALTKANNLDAAERSVTSLNLAPAATADWHLETAQRLVMLAEQVVRDGGAANVAGLARKALAQLTAAEQRPTTSVHALNIRMMRGFIYERLLGDTKSAHENYSAAARTVPESPEAKEASERLRKHEDARKLKNKVGK